MKAAPCFRETFSGRVEIIVFEIIETKIVRQEKPFSQVICRHHQKCSCAVHQRSALP